MLARIDRLRRRSRGPTEEGHALDVPLPVELTISGSRRELPLPAGRTRDDLWRLLASVSIDDAPPEELRGYLAEDFERFVHTWGLVADLEGQALEIGANPYFTTVMLLEHTSLDLTLTNCFGPTTQLHDEQRIRYVSHDGRVIERMLPYAHVNVERDRFPHADDTFDVVLFCEVIEHLLEDPIAALSEIRRVLRPGGRLVLTTPNVARLENVARLAAGANIYDPYSGYGPYGRHNREFSRHELHRLLTFCGFEGLHSFTADVHEHRTSGYADPALLRPLVHHRLPDLGQYLFVTALSAPTPTTSARPSFLYRSLPPDAIVPYE